MLSKVVAISAILGLAAAAPTDNCRSTPKPFHLTNLSRTTSGSVTNVKFTFNDPNTGINLTTKCAGAVTGNDDNELDTIYKCDDSNVHFGFNPANNKLSIDRGYHSGCGEPDYVQAYGHNTVPFKGHGSTQTAASVDITVTASTV